MKYVPLGSERFLILIDGLYSEIEAKDIIKGSKHNRRGHVMDSQGKAIISTTERSVDIHSVNESSTLMIRNKIKGLCGKNEMLTSFFKDSFIPEMLVYKCGDFYLPHKDSNAVNQVDRNVTFISNLHISPDFAGGELVIYHKSKHLAVTIPQKQNQTIIFNSDLVHGVNIVANGVRRALVCWM